MTALYLLQILSSIESFDRLITGKLEGIFRNVDEAHIRPAIKYLEIRLTDVPRSISNAHFPNVHARLSIFDLEAHRTCKLWLCSFSPI